MAQPKIKKSALAGAFSIGGGGVVCKSCGRDIPENSIYCNWCGEKQLIARRRREEVKVPAPRQLPSGSWNIVLRAEGQSVTEPTREKCLARARAIRAGFLEAKKTKAARGITLGEAIDKYIEAYSGALSPSTVRGYALIRANRFPQKINAPLSDLTGWQSAIDASRKQYAPKTVSNAWGLVCTVMRENGVTPPTVRLPQKRKKDLPWLDSKQIPRFILAIRGKKFEPAALLALHSLRLSEIFALTWDDIDLDSKLIHVAGARVRDRDNSYVIKADSKSESSRRTVKIMIPRLAECLAENRAAGLPPTPTSQHNLTDSINAVCRREGLPECGTHGLRRSFASLAYHLKMSELEAMQLGGWSDPRVMHEAYIRLERADRLKAENKMARFYSGKK